MPDEKTSSEWVIQISKARTMLVLQIALILVLSLLVLRGCQIAFTYPGTMITSEVLAPDHRGEPWGINYVARTIQTRKSEYLRIVRFIKGQEVNSRDEYFRSLNFKWLSGRHLLICKVGGNTRDTRGDEFTEIWHELKISYRLNFLEYTDLEKVCP